MITNERVFEPDYRPRRLVHRDAEQQTLARAFDPAFKGDRAADVLLSGPHGVGKTALVEHLLDRLARQVGIQYATVDCLGLTTAGIVRATLQALDIDVARTTPEADLCLQLRERITEPTIVVLDEADDVPETNALERLWDVPLVGVVAIVHDPDEWLSRLELASDYLHRPAVELGLDRYAPAELADILEPRAQKGLAQNVVDRGQLETIADRAAGNAREAILTLHASATVANEQGASAIRDADIPPGHERAQRWGREEALASLAYHHHVLYELVREAGEISSSALYDRYERRSEALYRGVEQTPIVQRHRRHKLRKLSEYGLIERDGRTLRVVDTGLASPLAGRLLAR